MGEDVDQTSEQKATKEEKVGSPVSLVSIFKRNLYFCCTLMLHVQTMLQAKEEDVKPKVFRSGVGKYIPVKEAEGIDPSLSG